MFVYDKLYRNFETIIETKIIVPYSCRYWKFYMNNIESYFPTNWIILLFNNWKHYLFVNGLYVNNVGILLNDMNNLIILLAYPVGLTAPRNQKKKKIT